LLMLAEKVELNTIASILGIVIQLRFFMANYLLYKYFLK